MKIQWPHANWMLVTALLAGAAACGGQQPGNNALDSQVQQALMDTPVYPGSDGGSFGGGPSANGYVGNLPPCTSVADATTCDDTSANGWMTGGGSVFTQDGVRVTHGFELHCDATNPQQHLEVNWDHGNRFHLQQLQFARCLRQADPHAAASAAGFDTFVGAGTGQYNGQDGATVELVLTDGGEPGRNDVAVIVVHDASGHIVVDAEGKLTFGNQQAHADTSTSTSTATSTTTAN